MMLSKALKENVLWSSVSIHMVLEEVLLLQALKIELHRKLAAI